MHELSQYVDDTEQFQLLLTRFEGYPDLVVSEVARAHRLAQYSNCEMIAVEAAMIEAAGALATRATGV